MKHWDIIEIGALGYVEMNVEIHWDAWFLFRFLPMRGCPCSCGCGVSCPTWKHCSVGSTATMAENGWSFQTRLGPVSSCHCYGHARFLLYRAKMAVTNEIFTFWIGGWTPTTLRSRSYTHWYCGSTLSDRFEIHSERCLQHCWPAVIRTTWISHQILGLCLCTLLWFQIWRSGHLFHNLSTTIDLSKFGIKRWSDLGAK